MKLLWILLAAAWPLPVHAQVPGRDSPGPYVVDVRGATSGVPTAAPFYPALGGTIAVPSRGIGFDVGAHVYLARLGASTLGVGASFARVRSTTPDASATVQLVAPQVSVNFGSGNGWSHLSAGIGRARVDTDLRGETTGSRRSGSLSAVNFGGGARWFLTDRAAVGFDVRFHRLGSKDSGGSAAGTPQVTLVTLSVGVSLR